MTRNALIEQTTTGYRIRIMERGEDDRFDEAGSLVSAVTAAGNFGVAKITVVSPAVAEYPPSNGYTPDYPYCAGYSTPGRGAHFATAEEAVAYARECKRAAASTQVSAYRELPDGGIHYLNIRTGEEFPRGERHRY